MGCCLLVYFKLDKSYLVPIFFPFVSAPFRSLPLTRLRKLPRLGEPFAFRVTEGVRLTKSAALAMRPLALVLWLLFHHTLVLCTSVLLVLSLEEPAKDKLLVNNNHFYTY